MEETKTENLENQNTEQNLATAEQGLNGAIMPSKEGQIMQYKTMWNDPTLLQSAWKSANFLAKTDLIPDTYKSRPENCLIAIDVSNRTGFSPLTVMQNLYVVKGKPAWSGQMVIAIINASGLFSKLEFVFVGEEGQDNFGCFARAIRISTGLELTSPIIDIKMAKAEGWLDKLGSKWKTMPRQMMQYRAGAFFGRTHCPELLLGIQTADEIRDSSKDNVEEDVEVITISMPKNKKGETK